MKTTLFRRLPFCALLALASTVQADQAPLWLTTTNTTFAPAGNPVLLRAIADGVPAPQFFWRSNAVPIAGASSNSLVVIAAASTTNVQWSVIASNSVGSSTNGPFYVRILAGTQSNAWGNVTLTGSNSVRDLLALGRHMSGAAPLSGISLALADANQDGVVNATDQSLVHQDILGRAPLAMVNQGAVADADADGVSNWREWNLGLFQSTTDTDRDGVSDGQELADGTDALDPTKLVPYGIYVAAPPVEVFNLTPNPDDAGIFVAAPPVTVKILP